MRRTLLAAIGALAVFVVLVAVPASAWADTVYSNFGAGGSFNTTLGPAVCGTSACSPTGQDIAAAFTPSADFTLSQIDVAFSRLTGYSGVVTVDLVNDSSGLPGSTVLESWSLTATTLFGNPYTPQSLLDTEGITLSSGSQYWVVALAAASADTIWNDNDTGVLGLAVRHGTGWGVRSDLVTPALGVFGTPISTPEPASLALMGTGLLGLGLAGLFGRKRAAA